MSAPFPSVTSWTDILAVMKTGQQLSVEEFRALALTILRDGRVLTDLEFDDDSLLAFQRDYRALEEKMASSASSFASSSAPSSDVTMRMASNPDVTPRKPLRAIRCLLPGSRDSPTINQAKKRAAVAFLKQSYDDIVEFEYEEYAPLKKFDVKQEEPDVQILNDSDINPIIEALEKEAKELGVLFFTVIAPSARLMEYLLKSPVFADPEFPKVFLMYTGDYNLTNSGRLAEMMETHHNCWMLDFSRSTFFGKMDKQPREIQNISKLFGPETGDKWTKIAKVQQQKVEAKEQVDNLKEVFCALQRVLNANLIMPTSLFEQANVDGMPEAKQKQFRDQVLNNPLKDEGDDSTLQQLYEQDIAKYRRFVMTQFLSYSSPWPRDLIRNKKVEQIFNAEVDAPIGDGVISLFLSQQRYPPSGVSIRCGRWKKLAQWSVIEDLSQEAANNAVRRRCNSFQVFVNDPMPWKNLLEKMVFEMFGVFQEEDQFNGQFTSLS
jgi:hypothetical protein